MIKRIFTTSIFSIISRFFSTGTNLLIVYYVSRYMGQAELGIYGIAFFFFQLFLNISTMGLPIFVSKEVAHRREDEKRVFPIVSEIFTAGVYGLGISLFVFLIALVFYGKISLGLQFITFIAGYFYSLEVNLGGGLLGKEKMHIEMLFSCLSFFIVLIFFWLVHGQSVTIVTVFLIRMIASVLGIAGRMFVIRQWLSWRRISLRLKYFRESKFYWFSNFNYFILAQIDVFILSFLISKSLLGGYFLAIRIYISVCIIAEVVSHALTPFISRAYYGREQINFFHFIRKIMWLALLGGLVLGVSVHLSRDLLISLFDKNFVAISSPFLRWLSLLIPIRFITYLLGAVMSSSKYQHLRFYLSLSLALLFLVMATIFSLLWSANGALLAKITSEILLFILYFYMVFFKVKKTMLLNTTEFSSPT